MKSLHDNRDTIVARLAADEATAKRIADVLAESLDPLQTVTVALEIPQVGWGVEVHFGNAPDEAAVRALVEMAADAKAAQSLTFERVEPIDWVKASLAGLNPVNAGRFVVHGAHDRAGIPPNRIGIEIEAALAFGTGHHGTTRGCLLALDALLKRRTSAGRNRRAGNKVLDVGTGTGVLAIAAAKVLRKKILATDIDAVAVRVARENARLNKTAGLVAFATGAGVAGHRVRAQGPYDLIFANILLGPLQRMAAALVRLTAPDARIVLSGLLPAHANAALSAYRGQGLALERRIVLDNWVTLVMRRGRPGRHASGTLKAPKR
jgi:ribosomal protein L11 methyltransferase